MTDDRFARLVELACHDLRTPLATVSGFAKTLVRTDGLAEREARFAGMIDEAAAQIAGLVDLLGLAARIESGRYQPELAGADTRALAEAAGEEGVSVTGAGTTVETSAEAAGRALGLLAIAALRFGELTEVTWSVEGRDLVLSPLPPSAAALVTGESGRDLGAFVARMTIEALGGSLAVEGETLRVRL
jgi:signal transduction histidine kinase